MTDASVNDAEPKKKKGLLPSLIIGLVLGGAGFYVTSTGIVTLDMILGADEAAEEPVEQVSGDRTRPDPVTDDPPVYVELAPIIVTVTSADRTRHLKVTIFLDVDPEAEQAVLDAKPRIRDLFNIFFRALDLTFLEQDGAIVEVRAHLLHRVNRLLPDGGVRDLLIQEFILN